MRLLSPAPGATVGLEGLEVLVLFPDGEATAPETFRALLNGADVTAAFTTSSNGAWAQLHELLEGDNVLRVEVFGRPPWGGAAFFEQTRQVMVRMRPPLEIHRG
jgi:hypothetical protein